MHALPKIKKENSKACLLCHHRDSLYSVIFIEQHVKYKMKVIILDLMPEVPVLHNYVLIVT